MARLSLLALVFVVAFLIWIVKQVAGGVSGSTTLKSTTMRAQAQSTMTSTAKGLNWLEKQWEQAKINASTSSSESQANTLLSNAEIWTAVERLGVPTTESGPLMLTDKLSTLTTLIAYGGIASTGMKAGAPRRVRVAFGMLALCVTRSLSEAKGVDLELVAATSCVRLWSRFGLEDKEAAHLEFQEALHRMEHLDNSSIGPATMIGTAIAVSAFCRTLDKSAFVSLGRIGLLIADQIEDATPPQV